MVVKPVSTLDGADIAETLINHGVPFSWNPARFVFMVSDDFKMCAERAIDDKLAPSRYSVIAATDMGNYALGRGYDAA